jgi:hypothetical protein
VRKLIDASDSTYEVTLNVNHYFELGDSATIILSDGVEKSTNIVDSLSEKIVTIRGQGNLDISDTYTLRRNISKAQSNTFPQANKYATNVQNVYKNGDDFLVASPSIPTYNGQPLNVYSQTVKFILLSYL